MLFVCGLMQRKCRRFQNSNIRTLGLSGKRDLKFESSFSFLQLQLFYVYGTNFCSEPEYSSRAKIIKIIKIIHLYFGQSRFHLHGCCTRKTRDLKNRFRLRHQFQIFTMKVKTGLTQRKMVLATPSL